MLPNDAKKPTYRGLLAFARAIDEPLERFQQRIAAKHFGPEHEAAAIVPRGNKKTTTAAIIGLHHLLTVPNAGVTIGAATRDQAKICFERMKGFAGHEALRGLVTPRTFELRATSLAEDRDPLAKMFGGEAILKVVPSNGERAHGLSSSLYIGDELWAWRQEGELLEAMQTGLIKRPDAKFLAISTAAARLDSPLGRLRERALAQQEVTSKGFVIEANGELAWIEWTLPEDESLDDMAALKKVNPAAYITTAALRRQRAAIPDIAFAQFHGNRWGVQEGAWLPAGAWNKCAGEATIEAGESVVIGVDIGGSRANSAVVIATPDLRVQAKTWIGDRSVLDVAEFLDSIASVYSIQEVAYDPWRFRSEALRLEEKGMTMVEFPQSHARMVPASERLYAAVTEGRLTHGNDPELNAHVGAAVAKQTDRGWRLDRSAGGGNIDAAVALAMAVDRAGEPVQKTALLGWI